jgi:hypothetical protein
MAISQRSGLGWFAVCIFLLWSSFVAAQTITPIFVDNFESYTVGTFPSSGGWSVYATGATVTNERAVSPTRSFVRDHRVATRGRRRSWRLVSLSPSIFLWTPLPTSAINVHQFDPV